MTLRSSKPNSTGRASGKQSGMAKKVMQAPKGEPFVQLTRTLLSSPAWRAMSINCRKLIDFLLIEHMNHAGQENGRLLATYDQLVEYGLTRSEIPGAIREAECLGLIRVDHGGRWAGKNDPSIFEVTFLYKLQPHPAYPTHDWRQTTDDDVARLRHQSRQARKRKKQKAISTSRTTPDLEVELQEAILDQGNQRKLQKSGNSRSSKSRTPSISTPSSAVETRWRGAFGRMPPKMIH